MVKRISCLLIVNEALMYLPVGETFMSRGLPDFYDGKLQNRDSGV